MTRSLAPLAFAALALAACQAEPPSRPANDAAAAPSPSNAVYSAERAPAAANAPGNALPAAPAAMAVPAALHGRWGLVPGDCTSTRGDAHGLLVIDGERLAFYESRATLRNVVEQEESRLVADFDFSGEGQNWQRRLVLDVRDGGRTLIRREQGEDAMPGVLRYRRCEAPAG